ncbi:hypothetical protein HUR95_12170 [Caldalkalibacillus thermarum TA2.A1]|uniref:Transposase IS4 family protein n=1 Tax=Caldalkalibacillus thermarum (strain TA2.A1) TaxID=986075 RepID=A0A8X8I2F7_CALTT|nr:hypothetical protein HUR95_12170 [Caldalkalibacillus thermarum TA2.A1]
MRHTIENKEICAMHKESIERVFTDLKEKLGIHWTTIGGMKKTRCRQCMFFLS